MASSASLLVGDPALWFQQRCTTPYGDYIFDMMGGGYVPLYVFASSSDPLA